MNTMFSAPRVRALRPTLERIAKDVNLVSHEAAFYLRVFQLSDEMTSMSGSLVQRGSRPNVVDIHSKPSWLDMIPYGLESKGDKWQLK